MNPIAPSEDAIWDALRCVVDPEIGLNLVDLGLIYSVRIDGPAVDILMTVTTPGCPMVHSLKQGVEYAVSGVPGVSEVFVTVVHDPPWNPSMMTAAGQRAANILPVND
ncbi:MAG: metal-sulfur cluster assembly factor [Verrucomicrobiae bacterium]|nr:metal-sulfur cluster assembly factor [Verrucomicrobiae bacterium]